STAAMAASPGVISVKTACRHVTSGCAGCERCSACGFRPARSRRPGQLLAAGTRRVDWLAAQQGVADHAAQPPAGVRGDRVAVVQAGRIDGEVLVRGEDGEVRVV